MTASRPSLTSKTMGWDIRVLTACPSTRAGSNFHFSNASMAGSSKAGLLERRYELARCADCRKNLHKRFVTGGAGGSLRCADGGLLCGSAAAGRGLGLLSWVRQLRKASPCPKTA